MKDKLEKLLNALRDPDLAISLLLYALTLLLVLVIYWSAPVFLSFSASPSETSNPKGRR